MQNAYMKAELLEAKTQIASALHKTREVLKTFRAKEQPQRYKSQITLAERRIDAFSLSLIKAELVAVAGGHSEADQPRRNGLYWREQL